MFQFLITISTFTIPYGNVLSLYRNNLCSSCNEIENILKHRELKLNVVDCEDELNCPEVPSLIYTRNRIKIGQSSDLSVLEHIVQDIKKLTLDGPWLILFYKDDEPLIEKYLIKIALDFPDLNVGKIQQMLVPKRYEIRKYPSIVAFYNSLSKIYEYSLNNLSFNNFVNTLLEPFHELTLSGFMEIKTHVFFIVFYQNEDLVDYHFKPFAHNYKFKARFFKSSDPDLLKLADVDFTKLRSPEKMSSDVLVLSVYKKRRFHKLIITKFNESVIDEWVFNSHYGHLTRVNNDNFYSVFNAFKPVILLLTRKEQLCEELERVSEEIHEVRPFISYLFAVVDVDQMTGFIDSLLPGLDVPKIIVYDPTRYLYYVHDAEIVDVRDYVTMLMTQYEKGLLETWPRVRTSRMVPIFLIIGVLSGIILFVVRGMMKRKIKIQ